MGGSGGAGANKGQSYYAMPNYSVLSGLMAVIRWLKLERLAFLILPTAHVPDRCFSRAELAPNRFLSRRLRWHSCFCERIFRPAKGAAAENADAGPGARP